MAIRHYPPADEVAADRLRAAAVAWAPLLGELHAVGLRPYLELQTGERDDPLRLYCELNDGLVLDVSRGDEELPDALSVDDDRAWVAFVQGDDGYLAEVMIERSIPFGALAVKLRDLVDAVAAGERPFLENW